MARSSLSTLAYDVSIVLFFFLLTVHSDSSDILRSALKAALTLFVGPRTCADVANRQWGIQSGQAASQAFLGQAPAFIPGQPLRGVGEGNRAGLGLLRWGKMTESDFRALVMKKDPSVNPRADSDHRTPLPLEEALASAARAIVGLVFQEHVSNNCISTSLHIYYIQS